MISFAPLCVTRGPRSLHWCDPAGRLNPVLGLVTKVEGLERDEPRQRGSSHGLEYVVNLSGLPKLDNFMKSVLRSEDNRLALLICQNFLKVRQYKVLTKSTNVDFRTSYY